MRIRRKQVFWSSIAILAILTIIFIEKDGFRQGQLRLTRIYKKITYFTEDQLAFVIYSDEHLKIPIKFEKQEHALTCETAALRMALNYLGISVTEEGLLKKLAFSTKDSLGLDNIWGDPDKGFVGDINGSIYSGTGYGVYEGPIRNLALSYRESVVFQKPTLSILLDEVNYGHPVIVWGLLSDKDPINWKTKDGKNITAFPGEHARIIIGYSGDISNPSHIILMDPIYGKIRMSKDKFLSDWAKLGNRAVVIL